MKLINTPFEGCFLFEFVTHKDYRGSFNKIISRDKFLDFGINFELNEHYVSNSKKNVIRGMHFQKPPYEQDKIVYCISGRALDVLVDIRSFSKTFGETFSFELSEESNYFIFIPKGVAHGFCALEDNTKLGYYTTSSYDFDSDSGFKFDSFAFNWPVKNPIVSDRDINLPDYQSYIQNTPFSLSEYFIEEKNAIVTGATGFIGSRLVISLIEKGWSVAIITRRSSRLDELEDILDKISVFQYDDYSELETVFKTFNAKIVFHLAANSFFDFGTKEIGEIINTNITFGAQILYYMEKYNIKYFINTGTSWQHYNNENYNPVNFYAATKQSFEDIIDYYVKSTQLSAITLKLFDTYGVNDPRNKLLNLLLETAKSGSSLELSPGEQVLNFVSIEDIVDAYHKSTLIFKKSKKSFHYFFALIGEDSYSIKELCDLIIKISNSKCQYVFGAKPYRKKEIMKHWNSKNILWNWRPQKGKLESFIVNFFK